MNDKHCIPRESERSRACMCNQQPAGCVRPGMALHPDRWGEYRRGGTKYIL